MSKTAFTPEAREALTMFLSAYPSISHSYHRAKINRAIDYYLLKEHADEVTKDILIRALEDAYPANEPSTLALKNPAKMGEIIKALQSVDNDNPLVKIVRWPSEKKPSTEPVKDIFAFLGSHRAGGNTDCVMDALLDGAREAGAAVEKVCFSHLTIGPCTGCLGCQQEKRDTFCVLNDDMSRIYKRFLECDAFVFGFPVYTGRESSQAAVFLDRLKALTDPWRKTKYKPRKGALVCTWGWPSPTIYDNIVHQLAAIFLLFGIDVTEVVTASGFWDAYYAKKTALLDKQGIEAARQAGKALVAS